MDHNDKNKDSKCLKRSIIGKILPLFTSIPTIKAPLICDVYAQKYHRSLSVKQYGFISVEDFYDEVRIFDAIGNGMVQVSRIKLLRYLLEPLLGAGTATDQLDSQFRKVNSFDPQILCDFCNAPSLEFLKSELMLILNNEKARGSNELPLLPSPHPLPRPVFPSHHPLLFPAPPRPMYPPLPPQRAPLPPHLYHPAVPILRAPRVGPIPLPVPRPAVIPPPSCPAEPFKQSTVFPDNGTHPKDEVHLPPLPGHPSLDIPEPTPTTLPPRPVIQRGEEKSKFIQKIDSYLKVFISVLSSQGKHLPVRVVTEELDNIIMQNHYLVSISRKDIKVWNDFDKLYKKIDAFIKMFCWQCPFTSVFELQRTILEFEKLTQFEELHLGPILKHPLIQKLFDVPNDLSSVPEITTYDILITLNEFVNKYKKGDDIYSMLKEYMEFFAKKFEAISPQHLCVRVSSFPMAISANLKFRTAQRRIRERREAETINKISEMLDFEINALKRSLRKMSENERDLIKKTPAVLIESVFMLSKEIFPSHLQSRLYTFFDIVLKDANLRKLFTVAMYQGVYGAKEYMKEQERQATSAYLSFPTLHRQEQFFHITRREVSKAIEEKLKNVAFPIDLAVLAEVEQSLIKRWNVNHFASFHHGSFLTFIEQDEQIVQCIGGRHIGGNTQSVSSSKRNRILGFISLIKDLSDNECVSSAIKDQFAVKCVEDLSCGSVDKLVSDAQLITSNNHHLQPSDSIPTLTYTIPLVINERPKSVTDPCTAGLLGPQSRADANDRLSQAPLLADLSEWTQWNLVYAPSLGPLDDYLMSQPESSNCVHALCDSTGRFLRIDPNSTRKNFETAVGLLDPVLTAGHLVSIAVSQTSVHLMSLQLLGECVTTKLEQVEGAMKESTSPVSELFVFRCLERIPLELCETLGKQVFLDPLKKVKNRESVNSLISLCDTSSQLCFFQALGMKLGVSHWINNYKEMKSVGELGDHFTNPHMELSGKTLSSLSKGQETKTVSATKPTFATPSNKNTGKSTIEYSQDSVQNNIRAIGEHKAKSIIHTIREEEFGVGLQAELTEKQQKISNKQTEREGRSLQRLSQELYSKDTHFVLELIQNADDNSYNLDLSTDKPTLQFVLHKDCVCVLNNEVGFSERNIRAICDVGKSTKDPSRSGYIGQKGIGFKSVFRITDAPEVHSNNFHIRFNTASGPIGYILPEWVDVSFIDGRMPSSELSKWATWIVLPTKQEGNSQSMVKKFKDIQPSLLLFLNRLRSIIIQDIESDVIRKMVRQDTSDGVTIISHNHGTDLWLVTRKELSDASKYKPGILTTELALAFPLPKDFSTLPNARDLQSQQVFAYLPLRSYGFRFIIQGDFDLPSSREDVNEDSTWNQWLREMIPSLFIEALENIKVVPRLNVIEAIFLFIQFIPLDGEVHDFFKPVTTQILRLLKSSEWLPTDPIINTDGSFNQLMMTSSASITNDVDIAWKQPSRLLMVPHDLIRDSIPQSILTSSLNLFYLNSSLVSHPLKINSDVCSYLGVGTMTVDHLVDIAKWVLDSYHSNSQSNSRSSFLDDDSDDESCGSPFETLVEWMASWLACVHTVIEDSRNIGNLTNIKKLPIIPLMDESLVALESVVVFFPPASNKSDSEHNKYKKIYKQLKTIHYTLLDSGGQVIRGQVFEILSDRLGVKELSPIDIINHHIIPGFNLSMKNDVNISYLKFVKENIDRCIFTEAQTSQIMEKLKDCVYVVTSNGMIKDPKKEFIHFSSEYKACWDFKALFPGVNWSLLSCKYLDKTADVASWRKFFTDLDIKSGLVIERIDHSVNPATQDQLGSIWNMNDWLRSPDGCYIVRDYYSREFDDIVLSNSTCHDKFSQMKSLAHLMDTCWDSDFKKCFEASYFDSTNTVRLGGMISSFGSSVRDKAWLPVMCVDEQPHSTPLMKGNELYMHKEEIVLLLDTHVPYLAYQLQSQDLIQAIGVKTKLPSGKLVEYLMEWSRSSSQQPEGFVTSTEHMKCVYNHLASNTSELEDIQKIFGTNSLIYIPTTFRHHCKLGNGEFVSVHDVCWTDKTAILYNMLIRKETPPPHLPRILSYFYYTDDVGAMKTMKRSFEAFGVEKGLKVKNLIDLFEFNSHSSPVPDSENIENFRNIAEVLIKSIYDCSPLESIYVLKEQLQSFFLKNIDGKKVFPTTNKKWSSLSGLMVDDNPNVSKYFIKSDKVNFLNWPKRNNEDVQLLHKFMEICKITALESNYSKHVVPSGVVQPSHELQVLFHHIVPLVQMYILTHMPQKGSQFHDLVAQTLQKLQFLSTTELNCVYSIGDHQSPAVQLRECQLITSPAEHASAIVYGVVDSAQKLLEKTSLVYVLQELVNIEDSKFNWFLVTLITDEPCSDADKDSVRHKYSLTDLSDDSDDKFPRWNVTLPQVYTQMEDLDEKMSDGESEGLTTPNQDNLEGSELKAWPPKAPVMPDKDVAPNRTHTCKSALKNKVGMPVIPVAENMVTSDYVMKMRSKVEQQPLKSPTVKEGEMKQEICKENHIEHDVGTSHQSSSSSVHCHSDSRNNPHLKEEKKQIEKNGLSSTHSRTLSDAQNTTKSDTQTIATSIDHQKTRKNDLDNLAQVDIANNKQNGTCNPKNEGSPANKTTVRHNFKNIEAVEISHLMQSVTFEPTEISLPSDNRVLKERMMASGQWGEVFVYTLLKKSSSLPNSVGDLKIVNVKWINEQTESGLPYDIEVTLDNGTLCYIEVKSTSSNDKQLIPFSWKELKFAQEKARDYYLVRVYNALGSLEHVRIKWLQNLYDTIENHQSVRLFLRF